MGIQEVAWPNPDGWARAGRTGMNSATIVPRIGLVMGDPCGISPELTARLLADDEIVGAAAVLVIADSRVLADGAKTACVELDLPLVEHAADADIAPGRPVLLDLGHLDPASVRP